MWYCGVTNVSLGIPLAEFLERFSESDYVLTNQHHHFGVVEDMTCPASYVNEGFGASNALFWYVPEVAAFFICLRGKAKKG